MYSVIVVIFVSQVFYSYSEETSKSKQYTRYKIFSELIRYVFIYQRKVKTRYDLTST